MQEGASQHLLPPSGFLEKKIRIEKEGNIPNINSKN
jgi:hypothetical protein